MVKPKRNATSDPPAPDPVGRPDNAAAKPAGRLWQRLPPLLIAAAGILAYLNTLPNEFIFDDHAFLADDRQIRELWPLDPYLNNPRGFGLYTFAISHRIDGGGVVGHHLVNMLIHVAAGLALFGVVRLTLTLPSLAGRFGASAAGWALAVALLWLLHPLNTQAVTYLVQRFESLTGLLFLLAMYSSIRYLGHGGGAVWVVTAAASCAAGMATKPIIAVLPLVVAVYDHTFVARDWGLPSPRRLGLYVPLVAVIGWMLAPTGVSELVTADSGAVAGMAVEGLSWDRYAMTQPGVVSYYLRLALWPHPLCLDHMWPPVLDWPRFLLPMLLLIGPLMALTCYGMLRRTWWGFLGAWFFIILGPTSSFVPIADTCVEHRMYLPLVGVVALVVFAVGALLGRWVADARARRVYAAVLVTLTAAALGAATIARNQVYRTEVSIWRSVLDVRPNNPRAHLALGKAYLTHAYFDEAGETANQLISLMDNRYARSPLYATISASARWVLGMSLYARNQLAEAERQFNLSLELESDSALAYYNRGQVRFAMANLPTETNPARTRTLLESAEADFRRSLTCPQAFRVKPEAYNMRGAALAALGRDDEAIEVFREAIAFAPDALRPRYALGNLLRARGDLAEAEKHLRIALTIQPSNGLILNALGMVSAGRGDLARAEAMLRQAVTLDRKLVDAAMNLAGVLQARGQAAEAEAVYRKLISQHPVWMPAARALAWRLATDPQPANRDADEALRLAKAAAEALPQPDTVYLDTLAAAEARAGDFAAAAKTAEQALALAKSGDEPKLAQAIQLRLNAYRQSQAFEYTPEAFEPWSPRPVFGRGKVGWGKTGAY